MKYKHLLLALVAFVCFTRTNAQIAITPNLTATQMVQLLVGTGVTFSNPVLSCAAGASAKFVATASNLGLDSGIVLTTGLAATSGAFAVGINGPQATLFATNSNGGGPDAQLAALANTTTFDRCVLEFDFVPQGDTLKFNYAFSSEEYDAYSCSTFNDVFAFFVTGPGITGTANIALIPNTNIPVSVNSTTNPAITQPTSTALCTAMGPGSPFAQYYVDNSAGTTVTHYGFTTVLTAIRPVTACTTYHLKLAIADGGDSGFDSGVFIKAGSLSSEPIVTTPQGGGGLNSPTPYCVRGCLPGKFTFQRPVAKSTPRVVKYLIAGTATNGVDYTWIPDSVIIPAFGTTAQVLIYAQPQFPATGPETVKLRILAPYTCNGIPQVIDSAELTILDSFAINITQNDTAICLGKSVQLNTFGDNLLSYTWSPTAGLSNPNIRNPLATPTVTTTYTVAATLPGSGCTPTTDQVTISIRSRPQINLGPDRTTCVGDPFTFAATVTSLDPNQTFTYLWTPATQLSSSTVLNPTFNATTAQPFTQYIITGTSNALQCEGYDTIRVRVLETPQLLNIDTFICRNQVVYTRVIADPSYSFIWNPTAGVSNITAAAPVIQADTTATYILTASYPGCTPWKDSFKLNVEPNPIVNVGPDLEKCQWDTLHLNGMVSPSWYPGYHYTWTPDSNLDNGAVANPVFDGMADANLTLTVVTDQAGCTGADNLTIIVRQGNFATLDPSGATSICPRDSVPLTASGGVSYLWTPALYIDDPTSPTPVLKPYTSTQYTGYVTDQYGCFDTLELYVKVNPGAFLELGDSIILYPGQTVTMDPKSNALYFSWFPPLGLSNPNASNPVASPEVNTRYFVTGATEEGCVMMDSVDVIIRAESVLGVPNAFTPGSSPNDILRINHAGAVTLKAFRIYNRWGTEVFSTKDINEGWNGAYKGEPQPMGVYVYQIEALTSAGRIVSKQGNVTLIR